MIYPQDTDEIKIIKQVLEADPNYNYLHNLPHTNVKELPIENFIANINATTQSASSWGEGRYISAYINFLLVTAFFEKLLSAIDKTLLGTTAPFQLKVTADSWQTRPYPFSFIINTDWTIINGDQYMISLYFRNIFTDLIGGENCRIEDVLKTPTKVEYYIYKINKRTKDNDVIGKDSGTIALNAISRNFLNITVDRMLSVYANLV